MYAKPLWNQSSPLCNYTSVGLQGPTAASQPLSVLPAVEACECNPFIPAGKQFTDRIIAALFVYVNQGLFGGLFALALEDGGLVGLGFSLLELIKYLCNNILFVICIPYFEFLLYRFKIIIKVCSNIFQLAIIVLSFCAGDDW